MNDSEGLLKGGKKKRNVCESLRASKQAVLRHRERVPVRRTDAYAQASGSSRCAVHRPAYWAGDPSQDRDMSGSCWLPSPGRRAVTGDGGNPSKLVFDPPEVVGDIKGNHRDRPVETQRAKETVSLGPLGLGKAEALVDPRGPANRPRATPRECRGHQEHAGESANPLPSPLHTACSALVQAQRVTGGPSNLSSCILDGKTSPPHTQAHRGRL